MNWKRILLALVTIAVIITLFTLSLAFAGASGSASIVPSVQADNEDSSAPAIEGAWRVVATAPNNETAYARETYTRGGGFVTSASLDVTPPGAGPGIGTWTRTGRKRFTATHDQFTQSGALKITQVVQVAGDTYTGSASLSFCDSAGENCSPPVFCFTLAGKRMNVEPLSCP